MITKTIYEKIMSHFPREGISMTFCYGSGVFKQKGHTNVKDNVLDFIIAVDNPQRWHQENLVTNRKHYSFLKYSGAGYISRVQDKYGSGMYYNTLVRCEDRVIKYGVIGTRRLVTDLLDWDSLYVSGRLHKPVLVVQKPKHSEIISAMHRNLQSALHTSLLLLPDTFTEEELYLTIAGLSYSGDFRMTVGEDKNKVMNIVKPNVEKFRELYEGIILQEKHVHWNRMEGTLHQPGSTKSQHHHLNLLPKTLIVHLMKRLNTDGRSRDVEETIRSLAYDGDCGGIVRKCVMDIVQKSSITQSIKTLLTAGLIKSVRYSFSKLLKMKKSMS